MFCCAAQADQGALVKQLSDHVLHLESSLSVANAQIAVNALDRQSLQNSIEAALRDLAAKKLAEDEEDAQEEGHQKLEVRLSWFCTMIMHVCSIMRQVDRKFKQPVIILPCKSGKHKHTSEQGQLQSNVARSEPRSATRIHADCT